MWPSYEERGGGFTVGIWEKDEEPPFKKTTNTLQASVPPRLSKQSHLKRIPQHVLCTGHFLPPCSSWDSTVTMQEANAECGMWL
ncbi:hypothetical protein BDZ89DRAFT_189752 [Hymenopellis radicata]|nr:hypothetical protein BDZ89DRAFT_189752 [Hymenopellis radicata]